MNPGDIVECYYDGKNGRVTPGVVLSVQGFSVYVEMLLWGEEKTVTSVFIPKVGFEKVWHSYVKTTDRFSIMKDLLGLPGDYYTMLYKEDP